MADLQELWKEALPEIRRNVTGVGVWAALNTCTPVTREDGVLVIGLPPDQSELAGHLRLPQVRRVVEQQMALQLNERVTLRIIEGTTEEDWETEKKRDQEKRRLQDQALQRAKRETSARSSWEHIYEKLARAYASTPNRSLPQNRAKFFLEAVELVSEGLVENPVNDDLAERNYARCIERIAQYSDLPSAFVALRVLEKTFS
jgi:hypothetical protein